MKNVEERLFPLVVAALLVLFAARAAFLLHSPYTVDYGEGTVWTYAQLLRTHGTYFLPIESPPWIHGTYPPVFPRLHAFLGGSLAAGRLLALLGGLLGAGSIAGILRGRGIATQRAFLWAAVFLVTPAVHAWSTLCRVDTVALGFSLLGLLLVERQHFGLAIPAFATALFTKQIAVAAPLATFGSLWIQGRRRLAVTFGLLYALVVVVIFTAINLRSGGQAAKHLITYTGFPGLAAGELSSWILRFAFAFPVLLPLAIAALPEHWKSPIGLYLVTGLSTLVLAGKPGATGNYLLEPSAACVLVAAVAVERRLANLPRSSQRRRDLALLLAVQLVAMCEPSRPLELGQLYQSHVAGAELVRQLNDLPPGPVLCEDLGLALAAGREPMLEPFQFGLLARAGMFDPQPLRMQLRIGAFQAAVVGWRLEAIEGVPAALSARYARARKVGAYDLWLPRDPTSSTLP